ncbi:hypothetical protein SAICODRAFT_8798 [Saitoella complicata NRRL Y-17804]|uniref:uncharacterized protein n=1 Tax=Saitoella complicata (strain BCRC 22490 / CBS 7301 / JCM 7358 / NBRC 10748 / NRRL Y-17804) TaxID=698492 RepID=UPI0008672A85|nr:uncharacterized protein SAICODRAFT_8798 [Saitoella complicata NRRL Y-17804]ODQ51497.1 hypothetical protein SAICODRAFT_8798 [Saitoella complicata NRRL Y-17804]
MATPHGLKLRLPESYNGKRDLMVIENWCFSVDQYLSLAEDIRAEKHSAIKRGLMKYFAPVNAARALRDEWHGSRQTTSVGEYVTRLNNLRIQIPEIRDIEFLDKFIHGLKPKVRLELELRNPQTLDEAIMIADRYDSITFSNRILN